MTPASLVLLHSPFVAAGGSWGTLPAVLGRQGLRVVAVDVDDDDEPPYAARYVARAALQLQAADPVPPTVLLGHSGAGYLLPQLGAALRAQGRPPAGYLFCDAGLPRGGVDRLSLLGTEDADLAGRLHEHLRSGGQFPDWTDADLADEVPDPSARARLLAALRPRGHAFFHEPLPVPVDWPDAPCGYLRLSAGYQRSARLASARGWPVLHQDTTHFAALTDPAGVAAAIRGLLDRM